jgi:hypothetical protein
MKVREPPAPISPTSIRVQISKDLPCSCSPKDRDSRQGHGRRAPCKEPSQARSTVLGDADPTRPTRRSRRAGQPPVLARADPTLDPGYAFDGSNRERYIPIVMLRIKHSPPEIREVRVRVGDKEVGIPYRPGQPTLARGGIPIIPKRIMRLLRLSSAP